MYTCPMSIATIISTFNDYIDNSVTVVVDGTKTVVPYSTILKDEFVFEWPTYILNPPKKTKCRKPQQLKLPIGEQDAN